MRVAQAQSRVPGSAGECRGGSNFPRAGARCQLVRKLWLREGGMRTSTHRRLWRSAVPRSYLGMGMCIPSSSADSMVRVA
jgi:hypothetical protein